MITGPCPTGNLLLLPLSTANALVTKGHGTRRGTGVNVRTTRRWPGRQMPGTSSAAPGAPASGTASGAPASGSAPIIGADASSRNAPASSRDATRPTHQFPSASRPTQVAVQRPPRRCRCGRCRRCPAEARARQRTRPLTRYVPTTERIDRAWSVCACSKCFREPLWFTQAPAPARKTSPFMESDLLRRCSHSRTLGLATHCQKRHHARSHHLVLPPVPKHPGGIHAVLDKTPCELTLARLQIIAWMRCSMRRGYEALALPVRMLRQAGANLCLPVGGKAKRATGSTADLKPVGTLRLAHPTTAEFVAG